MVRTTLAANFLLPYRKSRDQLKPNPPDIRSGSLSTQQPPLRQKTGTVFDMSEPSRSNTPSTSIQIDPPALSTSWSGFPSSKKEEELQITRTRPYSLLVKCSAEFLADCVFVFCGSMQAQAALGEDTILHAALTHGFTIFIMACSFGKVSGAVFNPAITLGIFVSGRMPLVHAILYIVSQLLGGFIGAFIVRALLQNGVYGEIHGGATLPGDTQLYQAFLAEVATSFVLMTVVLMTAIDTEDNPMAPLAIGMAHTADILATANISASMNPARSFGPQMVAAMFSVPNLKWSFHWIYYVGPGLGCSAAAVVYRFIFSSTTRII